MGNYELFDAPTAGRFGPSKEIRINQKFSDELAVPKRIVICADGTWSTPRRVAGGAPAATNVWLLFRLVKPRAGDSLPQLAYYHAGVGTRNFVDRIVGGVTGYGLDANIEDCYRFLIRHYRPGDHLYLFGFSRGAYTVRSLAGLIRNCGILDTTKVRPGAPLERQVRAAFNLYRDRDDASAPTAQESFRFRLANSHPDFRITCIGVWDTVGALGIPVGGLAKLERKYSFHDVTLSSWVDRAFQAVAINERRGAFEPTLWLQQSSGLEQGQKLEQVWFAGVHSDVGGGYGVGERGLANITLNWMVGRVTSECLIDLDSSRLASLPGQVALHDSMTWWYRRFAPCDRVIDAGVEPTGDRNLERLTQESLSSAAAQLCVQFASTEMPVVGIPYSPANVFDYLGRLTKASQRLAAAAANQGASSSSDLRTGAATAALIVSVPLTIQTVASGASRRGQRHSKQGRAGLAGLLAFLFALTFPGAVFYFTRSTEKTATIFQHSTVYSVCMMLAWPISIAAFYCLWRGIIKYAPRPRQNIARLAGLSALVAIVVTLIAVANGFLNDPLSPWSIKLTAERRMQESALRTLERSEGLSAQDTQRVTMLRQQYDSLYGQGFGTWTRFTSRGSPVAFVVLIQSSVAAIYAVMLALSVAVVVWLRPRLHTQQFRYLSARLLVAVAVLLTFFPCRMFDDWYSEHLYRTDLLPQFFRWIVLGIFTVYLLAIFIAVCLPSGLKPLFSIGGIALLGGATALSKPDEPYASYLSTMPFAQYCVLLVAIGLLLCLSAYGITAGKIIGKSVA